MLNKRYVLDPVDLQFRHHRLPWKQKVIRFSFWFGLSLIIAFAYNIVYQQFFESTKVLSLNQELGSVRLKYNLLDKQMDDAQLALNNLNLSDDKRYRPILELDSIPQSSRHPGYGGVDRYSDLAGFANSALLISSKTRIEDILNQVNSQKDSFDEVETSAVEWKNMWEHLPYISPVRVTNLGDKMGFRPQHPVTGEPKWHTGQDFHVPLGTEVYATGAGKVVESGWSTGGFGNYVVIDHGYGYNTTYGHLSRVDVSKGLNVKRGDILGLSGSTGISTGPHLHYQIDLFGKHENPLNFFDTERTAEEYGEMIQILSAGKY